MDTFHTRYPDKLVPLSTRLYNITLPELSPNRGILSWPDIPKSMIYDITTRILCEIMVHHAFEYCSLTDRHSSSRLGNSMSPTLYGLVQPSEC
jgi:hypothetical protein